MARVPDAERLGDVGLHEDALHFRLGQRALGQPALVAGHFQLRGRIMEQDVLAAQPAEVVLDRHHALALGGKAERVAILFAVVVHPPLVAFEDGPRHVLGPEQVALLAPA